MNTQPTSRDDFPTAPGSSYAPYVAVAPAPPPSLPKRIGRYEIKEELGGGGMGLVYLAVQDNPRRTVAVKVLRAGPTSRAALRRFEYEAQLLARLRHPGIAQVYEADTHEDDRGAFPFFAMEYVPGAASLIAYANTKQLGLRDRLDLFLRVCDAVQHGHQKGVIHRDLKPANILVDSAGQPKVIDFGVARGVDSDMAGATLQTGVGQIVGTLQYMSPEQCSGDAHGVDVRADVYALGVILYELLTGQRPYDLANLPMHEATRVVCEWAPTRPAAIAPLLRGDLETILLKSLEKDRDRRYQSAGDLAADLGRYLRHEPITARPVGPGRRLAKWVRRNREIAVVGGIALAALVTVSAVSLVRIVRAEATARTALADAEKNLSAATKNYELVRGLIESMRPEPGSQGSVNVERLIDESIRRLEADPPDLASKADFLEVLGVTYAGLRAIAKAKATLAEVLAIRQSLLPDPSAGLADALHNLAAAHYWDGDYEGALPLYERSHAMRRTLFSGDHKALAFSLTHLAACRLRLGDSAAAERMYREALSMRERLYGPMHAEVAASLNNLAKFHVDREEYDRAEPLYRRSLEMISTLEGPAGENASHAAHNLGICLLEGGRPADAKSRLERAVEIRTGLWGESNAAVAASRLGLARTLARLGDWPGAEREARAALGIFRGRLRSDHPDMALALEVLGEVLTGAGRAAEGEPLLREAVEICRNARPPIPLDVARAQGRYGACLTALGRFQQAEPMLVESLSVTRASRGDQSRRTAEAAERLAALYLATQRPTLADALSPLRRSAGAEAP